MYIYTYIYIYIFVCVCVCISGNGLHLVINICITRCTYDIYLFIQYMASAG